MRHRAALLNKIVMLGMLYVSLAVLFAFVHMGPPDLPRSSG